MIDVDAWVPLAEVARPHGVKGELKLKLFNADSEVLLELDEVLVRMPDGVEREVAIERARRADDAILMTLASVDDRDKADALRGAMICVKRRDFPALDDEDEFYLCDALGTKVVGPDGEIGTVRDLMNYPTVDVLVVRASDGGKDWEIPLVEAYIESFDLAAGVVKVHSLEGLERA